MSNWIQLASGGGYDFDNATIMGPFEMAQDIAWPLAGLNRYVHHTTRPWDVAVHSVVVARTIEEITKDKEAAAAGLLHELHEAVIGDIPTPVAWHIGYEKVKELKAEVQEAIYWRLKTPPMKRTEAHKLVVETADHAALHVEKQLFMVPEPAAWSCPVPSHEWMLAAWHQTRRAMLETQQIPSAQLFIGEYLRLVEGKEEKKEPVPPTDQLIPMRTA